MQPFINQNYIKQQNNNITPENVLRMAYNGDIDGLRRIAEEECKRRNIDLETALNNVKNNCNY